jgi:hypothetical protein
MSDIYTGDYDAEFVKANMPAFEQELLSDGMKKDLIDVGYIVENKTAFELCHLVFTRDRKKYDNNIHTFLRDFEIKWRHYISYYLFFNIQKEQKMTIKISNHLNEDICIIHIPFTLLYDGKYFDSLASTWFFFPYLLRPEIVTGIMTSNKDAINAVNHFVTYSSKGATEALLKMIKVSNAEYYKALISKCEVTPIEE